MVGMLFLILLRGQITVELGQSVERGEKVIIVLAPHSYVEHHIDESAHLLLVHLLLIGRLDSSITYGSNGPGRGGRDSLRKIILGFDLNEAASFPAVDGWF